MARPGFREPLVLAAATAALAGAGGAVLAFFKQHIPGLNETSQLAELVPTLAALLTTSLVVITGVVTLFGQSKLRENSATYRISNVDIERIRAQIASAKSGEAIPFEIEQLASYYSLTLGQARVSFWFSLIFAAIGFLVIVGGAALYTEGGIVAASVKIISGIVIDAVSALFFVQSRRAQESMSAFFEKLRSDGQFVEARKICEELSDDSIKDHLKVILVLHYSGLDSKPMIETLPSRLDSPLTRAARSFASPSI